MGISRRGAGQRLKDHRSGVFNKMMGFALDGTMLHGIHENMLRSKAHSIDPTLTTTCDVIQAVGDADVFLKKCTSGQNWFMLKYVAASGVRVHGKCAMKNRMRPQFPRDYIEFKSTSTRRRGILRDLASGFSEAQACKILLKLLSICFRRYDAFSRRARSGLSPSI